MRRAKNVPARIAAQIAGAKGIAEALAKQIPFDVTRLVVAQSLLPYLWNTGVLSARTFSVLMTRLPLSVLHSRLDEALRRNPERDTLGEFRAPSDLVEAERAALEAADRIVTPHREIARLFPAKVDLLEWKLPSAKLASGGRQVVFPGPTVARKGAYEMREAARSLDLEVTLLGNELEGKDFWQEVRTRRGKGDWLRDAAVVVQPALVEDSPRTLLAAIASGIPVIATPACGLQPSTNLHIVPSGDLAALQSTLRRVLEREKEEVRSVPVRRPWDRTC
jgi:glycosyltransferase involved in cell wall biosynthesis